MHWGLAREVLWSYVCAGSKSAAHALLLRVGLFVLCCFMLSLLGLIGATGHPVVIAFGCFAMHARASCRGAHIRRGVVATVRTSRSYQHIGLTFCRSGCLEQRAPRWEARLLLLLNAWERWRLVFYAKTAVAAGLASATG
jgi:hypothetical protein